MSELLTHKQFSAALIGLGVVVFWVPYLAGLGIAMMGTGLLILLIGWLKPPTRPET